MVDTLDAESKDCVGSSVDVAQLVERRTGTLLTQFSIPQCGEGFFFLPESTFSADSLTVSVHHCVQLHAIKICAHVKDPVVYVRVRWIMETLEHSACKVG